MKTGALILTSFAGLTVGVIATLAAILAMGQTIGGFGLGISERDSDKAVARVLTGRLAQTFVGAEKFYEKGRLEAVSFYDTPVPYGRNLCRFNRFQFADSMVRGERGRPEEPASGALNTSIAYALAPSRDGSIDRKDACAHYRAFSRVIGVSSREVGQGQAGEALDRIIDLLRQAKDPRARFIAACNDEHGPCDAREKLAAIDLRRVVLVSPGALTWEDGGYSHKDLILVCRNDGPRCSDTTDFWIEGRLLPDEAAATQNRLKSVVFDPPVLIL